MFDNRFSGWASVVTALAHLGLHCETETPSSGLLMTSAEVDAEVQRAALRCEISDDGPVTLLCIDAIDVRSFGEETIDSMLGALNLWHASHRFPVAAVEVDPDTRDTYRIRAHWTIPVLDPPPGVLEDLLRLVLGSLLAFWTHLAAAGISGEEPVWAEADRGLDELEAFLGKGLEDPSE